MTGFTSAADNGEERTKHEDGAIADEGSDPDYVEDDENEIAAIGLALINAILEYAPIEEIQKLLDEDAPLWYQGEEDGWSALHAAAIIEADALVLREEDDTALGSTDKFLSSRLRYTIDEHGQEICLLQSGDTEIGVMMGWERGISAFTAFERQFYLHAHGR